MDNGGGGIMICGWVRIIKMVVLGLGSVNEYAIQEEGGGSGGIMKCGWVYYKDGHGSSDDIMKLECVCVLGDGSKR